MHKLVKVSQLDKRVKARTVHVLSLVVLTFLHVEGIIAISTGIWLIARLKSTSCEFLNQFVAAGVFWFVSGLLCTLVSIPGILMTFRHKQYLRPPYFIGGFIIIIILESTAAIVSTLDSKNLSNKFQGQLLDSLLVSPNRECWEDIQGDFECCGATKYQNWLSGSSRNISVTTTLWGLSSCRCEEAIAKCIDVTSFINVNITSPYIWPSACYQKLLTFVELQCNFLRIFCPIVAISQLFACTFLGYVFKKLLVNNAVQTGMQKYMIQFSSRPNLRDNSKSNSNCHQASSHM